MTQKEPANGSQLVLPMFLTWYFSERPHAIVHLYLRFAQAFSETFSFMFILKTLFAPWKSITDEYPKKGFNLEEIAATFFLNLTSRGIGFIFRIVAMVTGLLIQVALLVGFMTYLLVWMLFPIIVILAVPVSFAF